MNEDRCFIPTFTIFFFLSDRTMIVGRGTQVSQRIFKEPSKGIPVRGVRRGIRATVVKKKQKGRLEPIALKNMDLMGASHNTWRKDTSRGA